jgi:hypothetical protein
MDLLYTWKMISYGLRGEGRLLIDDVAKVQTHALLNMVLSMDIIYRLWRDKWSFNEEDMLGRYRRGFTIASVTSPANDERKPQLMLSNLFN